MSDSVKERAMEHLRVCAENSDKERAHVEADAVLCAFLVSEGHRDLVDLYEKVGKWYA